jgi:cytochrome c-type biogenesis protein CcmH/NrfG
MLAIWPNDPAVQNDEAYTRLLLAGSQPKPVEAAVPAASPAPSAGDTPATTEEVESIEKLAAQLVQREPSSLPHRTLLALARLRLGKFSDAMDAYSNIQVSRGALTPSALAVHAAVLAANGRADDAAAELRELDAKALLPEEAALIAGIAR